MPVVGKSSDEIRERADTICILAELQLQQPTVQEANVAFSPDSGMLVAECYFALSEGYKKRRLKSTSRTEWCKAAALVANAVSIVRPLRPAGPADKLAWPYLNPNFGMLCAYGHVQEVFFGTTFDAKRRLLQALQSARLPCLDPIIMEANTVGKVVTAFDLNITDGEMSYLDAMVTQFEALVEIQTLLAENERLKALVK